MDEIKNKTVGAFNVQVFPSGPCVDPIRLRCYKNGGEITFGYEDVEDLEHLIKFFKREMARNIRWD